MTTAQSAVLVTDLRAALGRIAPPPRQFTMDRQQFISTYRGDDTKKLSEREFLAAMPQNFAARWHWPALREAAGDCMRVSTKIELVDGRAVTQYFVYRLPPHDKKPSAAQPKAPETTTAPRKTPLPLPAVHGYTPEYLAAKARLDAQPPLPGPVRYPAAFLTPAPAPERAPDPQQISQEAQKIQHALASRTPKVTICITDSVKLAMLRAGQGQADAQQKVWLAQYLETQK